MSSAQKDLDSFKDMKVFSYLKNLCIKLRGKLEKEQDLELSMMSENEADSHEVSLEMLSEMI